MGLSVHLIFTALAFNIILSVGAIPAMFSTNGRKGEDGGNAAGTSFSGSSSYGTTSSDGNGFSVVINTDTSDGQCVSSVKITGAIIKDTFLVPCSTNENINILNGKDLVIGDPNKTPVSFYSNDPSTIIEMTGNGKCAKFTYTNLHGKTTSTISDVTDEECALIKKRMEDDIEQNRIYWEEWSRNFEYINKKYWEEWSENFEEQMKNAFPPGFPFN